MSIVLIMGANGTYPNNLDAAVEEQRRYYSKGKVMPMKTDNMIFVFGSNLAGIHGAGAAAYARNFRGAAWGVGVGHTGQSYALPTKGARKQNDGAKGVSYKVIGSTLPLNEIKMHVDRFIDYACEHPELHFQVTCIGCGLAGLKHEDIAPMFKDAPSNCYFDEVWAPFMGAGVWKYWGTF